MNEEGIMMHCWR